MLSIENLSISIADRILMENVSLKLNNGDKVGLIGPNGAGKTTFTKILTENYENFSVTGTVSGNKGLEQLGYLPQDTHIIDTDIDALTYIFSSRGLDKANLKLHQCYEEMSSPDTAIMEKAMADYEKLEKRFGDLGGYEAKSEVEQIIASLGLEPSVLDNTVANLSGGQKRRVELAKILFSKAKTIILDEPTNHLDKESVQWLKQFIIDYEGGILMITHDIPLLSATCNKIWHLDPLRTTIDVYNMNYNKYLEAVRLDDERRDRENKRATDEAQRLETIGNKLRAKASKAAFAQQALRRAEELKKTVTTRQKPKVANLEFPTPLKSYRLLLDFKDLSKSYGDHKVFNNISLSVEKGEKVSILGLNGAGKTTLLKLITGDLQPDSGTIKYGEGLKIGYFAQEHDKLKLDKTLLENLQSVVPPAYSDEDCRTVLGSFKFSGDDVFKKAKVLSGGEKTRLSLAMLVVSGANLLLLDEPTNNLDPESRDQILSALHSYEGATLLVTHDIDAMMALDPGRVLLLPKGQEDIMKDQYLDQALLS
jgi:ATPase subunit of ABC transporter with duplicated ATPase domains